MNFTKENIYREWACNVSAQHTMMGSGLVIATMAAFAVLDFVGFDRELAQHFALTRLGLIAGLLAFILGNFFLRKHRPDFLKRWAAANMLIPVLALNFTFLYFVVHIQTYTAFREDLLKGTIVTLIVTYAAIGRFRAVAILSCLANVAACIGVHLVWNIDYAFRSLLQYHLVSFFVFSVINRNVKIELFDRFNAMKRFLPARAAYQFVTTSNTIEELEDSQPKERFTAFVVSDWRSYQTLSRQMTAEQLSRLFRDFYGLVFRKLPDIVPDLTYYISWTADEHRVVFYSNTRSDSEVMLMALRYVDFLSMELPKIVRSRLSTPISYDVGVSCGRSVTGLQGPEECAQYSISGEHPGIAKRLESEAAYYRRKLAAETGRVPDEPIALFTEAFKDLLLERETGGRQLIEARSVSADTIGLPVIGSFGPGVDLRAIKTILNTAPVLHKMAN